MRCRSASICNTICGSVMPWTAAGQHLLPALKLLNGLWSAVQTAVLKIESDREFTPVMTQYFLCISSLYNVCVCLCCCPTCPMHYDSYNSQCTLASVCTSFSACWDLRSGSKDKQIWGSKSTRRDEKKSFRGLSSQSWSYFLFTLNRKLIHGVQTARLLNIWRSYSNRFKYFTSCSPR